MDNLQKFYDYLWGAACWSSCPRCITILACLIFVATRWKRYPKVSAPLVLVGLGLLLLHAPVFAFCFAVRTDWLPDLLVRKPASANAHLELNVVLSLI